MRIPEFTSPSYPCGSFGAPVRLELAQSSDDGSDVSLLGLASKRGRRDALRRFFADASLARRGRVFVGGRYHNFRGFQAH